jgi:hypothetical protein
MKSNSVSGGHGAHKPFVTEYKLAFKDPTPFLRKGASSTTQRNIKRKNAAAQKKKNAVKPLVPPSAEESEAVPYGKEPALPNMSGLSLKTDSSESGPVKTRGRSKKDLWVRSYN